MLVSGLRGRCLSYGGPVDRTYSQTWMTSRTRPEREAPNAKRSAPFLRFTPSTRRSAAHRRTRRSPTSTPASVRRESWSAPRPVTAADSSGTLAQRATTTSAMADSPNTPMPDRLLAEVGFVRELAAELTRLEQDARDVEQQTLIGALGGADHPPRDPPLVAAGSRATPRRRSIAAPPAATTARSTHRRPSTSLPRWIGCAARQNRRRGSSFSGGCRTRQAHPGAEPEHAPPAVRGRPRTGRHRALAGRPRIDRAIPASARAGDVARALPGRRRR